jgi:toxin ParE1/3/4
MKRFFVTGQAASDLKEIGRYSRETWGKRQSDHYLRQLAARFQWISDNLNAGRKWPDLHESILSFPDGEHLVFYRKNGDSVEILRVLHKRMDQISSFG